MIPLYLLTVLSCLTLAGAVPFAAPLHIPLTKRAPLSVNEYWAAADALRVKYGVPYPSLSKRHNTGIGAVPITDRVCPCSTQ